MKIMHISDLHFGMHRPEILAAFLNDVEEFKPEVVLISGDITQRAKKAQFQMAHDFIQAIPNLVLCVPGNHDIAFYNIFKRWLNPFDHYRHYIAASLQARYENNTVRILGVNSADADKIKDGTLSEKELQTIDHYFSESTHQFNILFFHHNFSYFEGMHGPLKNEKEIVAFLKNSLVDLVCTGHLHYSNQGLIERNDGKKCILLHAGSLMCERTRDNLNSYYLITVQQGECTIEWRVMEGAGFVSRTV